MSIIIKKVRLKGRRLNLSYEQAVLNGRDVIDIKCASKVHPDLENAFEKLIPHMIFLCELPEESELSARLIHRDISDCTEGFPKIEVSGISIGGEDEGEGVTLIGSRLLNKGASLNLVSPFQKYDPEDYTYAMELRDVIQSIISEVQQFLDGKVAEVQLDMYDETPGAPDGDNPFAEVEPPVQKKRGRKKKDVEHIEPAA